MTPRDGSSSAAEGSVKRQRNRTVCTTCRQAKTKCDAAEKFPGSCSRCLQDSVKCVIDSQFRRSRKRQAQGLGPSPIEKSIVEAEDDSMIPANSLPEERDEQAGVRAIAVLLDDFSLGGVNLSLTQGTALFKIFYERFHPHCPILLRHPDPVQTYLDESFLFWAIVTVAGRAIHMDSTLETVLVLAQYNTLLAEMQTLALEMSAKQPRSIAAVQGLLILATWGLPSSRQKDDRGWHFTSVAIQTGYLMGLHRPFHSFEYTSRPNHQATASSPAGRERTLCWIYCHILANLIAFRLGVPPMIQDDWVSIQASQSSTHSPSWLAGIPPQTLVLLKLALFLGRISRTFGNSPSSPNGLLEETVVEPIWNNLHRELLGIEAGLVTPRPMEQVFLETCRIQLCCYGLQSGITGQLRSEIAAGLLSSTIRTIDIAESVEETEWLYWPDSIVYVVILANVVLNRLRASVDARDFDIESPNIMSAIAAAYRLASKSSCFGGPSRRGLINFSFLTARDAQFRTKNARLYGSRQRGDPPEIHTRMGAPCYLHDCLGTIKRLRNSHAPELPLALDLASGDAAHTNTSTDSAPYLASLQVPLANDNWTFGATEFEELLSNFLQQPVPAPLGAS